MTPEDIERMAREAGFTPPTDGMGWGSETSAGVSLLDLTRFAALVRAQALEDAAQSVQTKHPQWCECGRCHDAPQIAAAIRALGDTK